MKKKLIIIAYIALVAVLILSSCSKEKNADPIKETDALDFCKKLSTCSEASINIEDSSTKDRYRLDVLGKDAETCSIGLSLEKANTVRFVEIEKLGVVCNQEWDDKFEKIASFDEQTCMKYIDTLMLNTLHYAADKDSTKCRGELRERLIR